MGIDLHTLALDLRRCSSYFANELWEKVDPELWKKTRNPWLILQTLSDIRKKELEQDKAFSSLLKSHLERREKDLQASNWFEKTHGKTISIAYFSMEFGVVLNM